MTTIRKKHNKQTKFKAALELLKSEKTIYPINLKIPFGLSEMNHLLYQS